MSTVFSPLVRPAMLRLRDLGLGLLELLAPTICFGCGVRMGRAAGPAICQGCAPGIPATGPDVCLRCAMPLGPHLGRAGGCPACRGRRLAFSGAVAAGRYGGLLRDLILELKEGGDWVAAFPLAALLHRALETDGRGARIDAVAAVPLHWTRRLKRGFNQAEAIARPLARRLGRPFLPRVLRKSRPTPPQRGLARRDRLRNLAGSFRCPRPRCVAGLRILLVDDVMTTAATLDAGARALRAAGAREVLAAAAARA